MSSPTTPSLPCSSCYLAHELESHYAGQLHRYYHREDPRQHPLWLDDDPPF